MSGNLWDDDVGIEGIVEARRQKTLNQWTVAFFILMAIVMAVIGWLVS